MPAAPPDRGEDDARPLDARDAAPPDGAGADSGEPVDEAVRTEAEGAVAAEPEPSPVRPARRRRRRRLALSAVAVVAAVVVGLLQLGIGSRQNVYASDRFAREVGLSWGRAEVGGEYHILGSDGRVDVDGSVGMMRLPRSGASKAALLRSTSARDVDVRVRVATDKWPIGGRQFVYVEARVAPERAYRATLSLTPTGAVTVHAGKVLSSEETELGSPVTVAGLQQGAGEYVWLRARFVGADPTRIMVRAWAEGSTEPTAWFFSAVDATPQLQEAGALGLRAYLGSRAGNAPITVAFDDLLAVDPGDDDAAGDAPPSGSPEIRIDRVGSGG